MQHNPACLVPFIIPLCCSCCCELWVVEGFEELFVLVVGKREAGWIEGCEGLSERDLLLEKPLGSNGGTGISNDMHVGERDRGHSRMRRWFD